MPFDSLVASLVNQTVFFTITKNQTGNSRESRSQTLAENTTHTRRTPATGNSHNRFVCNYGIFTT